MGEDFLHAYEEHVFDVYGFLAYRTRSVADAEDLTQQTFERALRAWERFDPERGEVRTWLLAIARNVYIDHRRAGKKRGSDGSLDVWKIEPPDPRSEAELEEVHGLSPEIAKAVAKLSTRQREALALRFGTDLRIADVADVMDVTVVNAQQILSRAMRRLRTLLETEAETTGRKRR